MGIHGHETVLDAGADTRSDTLKLLNLLPQGRVIALDALVEMLTKVKRKISGLNANIEVVHSNLTMSLCLNKEYDAAISVATIHWIKDHQSFFVNSSRAMKHSAILVSDSGASQM